MDSYKIKLGLSNIKKFIDVYPTIIKPDRIYRCCGYFDRWVNIINYYMLRFINR